MQSKIMYQKLSLLPAQEADFCINFANSVKAKGGRAFLVGGCVRDSLLGLKAVDGDIEVFGISAPDLRTLMNQFPHQETGKAFAVYKLKHLALDISLPRREYPTGPGHKDFRVEGDPFMNPVEACERRDFTINAIMMDPLNGEIVDPLGGRIDLTNRILRHCSPRFGEDPLRVLRAMQFIARFSLTPAEETVEVCTRMTPASLSQERIFEEWRKLILSGVQPSLGLKFLQRCGWLRFFPELADLQNCPQDPEWHPEGDVWEHTLHTLDAFASKRLGDQREDCIVGLAVLCHDFGKPLTTVFDRERWRAPGHEAAGEQPTRDFLGRMTREHRLIDEVAILVRTHMRPSQLYNAQASDSAVKRLAREVGRIDRLVRVSLADSEGRPPLPGNPQCGEWLLEQAEKLSIRDQAPAPLLKGRDLIVLGLAPGPNFGEILDAAFEAQLNGTINDKDQALNWLKKRLSTRLPEAHS